MEKYNSPKPLDMDALPSESPDLSLYEKVKRDILYLHNLKTKTATEIQSFINESKKIMQGLTKACNEENLYLPWVRFLGVAYKVYKTSRKNIPAEFKKWMQDIVECCPLRLVDKQLKLDWRIARKMIAYQEMFDDFDSLEGIDPMDLVAPIKKKLKKAKNYLEWDKGDVHLALHTIKSLLKVIDDEKKETKELLREAIITGRFDKEIFEDFGLQYTVILGEDGGLYLLLNRFQSPETKAFIAQIVGQGYLQDKISEDGKVILGEGTFGRVRFALNLTEGAKKPNDLICVKKTHNYSKILAKSFLHPLEAISSETLREYFSNDLAEVLSAPKLYDMTLVDREKLKSKHKKGYLMMEIVPQNTGNKMFSPRINKVLQVTEYQKWEHQKPYILAVLNAMLKLFEKGVAMTDIKPENTLYDKDLRRATIIDFGGATKPKSLSSFSLNECNFQKTRGFISPEIEGKKSSIDLRKSIAYSCGRVIEDITERTDYPNLEELKKLIGKLTDGKEATRMSIQEAIAEISNMGDEDKKILNSIWTHYIQKLKEKVLDENHPLPDSIGLDNDILDIVKFFIPLEVTAQDCSKRFSFEKRITEFFLNSNKKVFLLLGEAGTGKSTALQHKFIEAVQSWNDQKPLPIYFNLANGINLEKILCKLNQELKTGLSLDENLQGKSIHLYLDNFDQGFFADQEKKKSLIQCLLSKLPDKNSKVIVSCCSDCSDLFFPIAEEVECCYAAPLNFEDENELILQVQKFLEAKKMNNLNSTCEEYSKKIKDSGVPLNIRFMLHLALKPFLHLKDETTVTEELIYKQYVQSHHDQIKHSYTEYQKTKIDKHFPENLIQEFAQKLAAELEKKQDGRIDQSHNLFNEILNYKPSKDFQHQKAYYFLRLLPLKLGFAIFENNEGETEIINLSFKHDTLRNYYFRQTTSQFDEEEERIRLDQSPAENSNRSTAETSSLQTVE